MERAAEEAKLSLWVLMDVLRRERVPHSTTAEDVRESLNELRAEMGALRGEKGGFQAQVDWLGSAVITLADVPPAEGNFLLVGINPAPVSVAAGHYHQGQIGKRLWTRLRRVGLLTDPVIPGAEDESFAKRGPRAHRRREEAHLGRRTAECRGTRCWREIAPRVPAREGALEELPAEQAVDGESGLSRANPRAVGISSSGN